MNYKFKDCDRKATEGLVQQTVLRKRGLTIILHHQIFIVLQLMGRRVY